MTVEDYMRLAIAEAQAASLRGEVPVGAVLVNPETEEIIARTGNAPIAICDPTAHAEILALRDGAYKTGNYRLSGFHLYVTLEPCAMCAGAIANARIEKLVYGASDPKGGAVENGVKFFDQASCHHRPKVTSGIMTEDCADLLKQFFKIKRDEKKRKKASTRQRGK
jgi:tRNA(Arg) A34 adenosine deaminase TadA